MRVAWLPRTLLASLVVVVVVLCAGLAPSPSAATEEPADDADDATITTTLYPGWNMVGWVGPETPASELFDELPALGRIVAWDAEEQRYLRLMPSSGSMGDQHLLTPGDGLWLYIGGTSPVEWTREASEDSVLLDLRAGPNLVAWAGRDGTPTEEAVARLGDRLELAWAWNAEVQEYRLYHPSAGLDQVQALNHGDALLLELSNGGRWWQPGAAPPPVVFLGEFTEERQAEISGWVDDTRALFGERWGVGGPVTTTYVGDREAVAPTYRMLRGKDVITCGDYGGWVIFLVGDCVNEGAHAHEYFHALQGHLTAWSGKQVPGWMIEGSATYALILYRGSVSTTQTADERIQEARQQDAVVLRRSKLLPLSELEDYSATIKPGNSGYTLGFLAVAWLAERAGEQSIIDFFVRLADAPGWREAFEGAFGLVVDDFYEHFAAYLAEVAAPLPHLTDDSPEPALQFVGDVPAATREAVREEFERIQTFFVEELGAGTADYTMLVAADDESAETAHRLVLSTEYSGYCNNVLFGAAGIVNLGCGVRNPEYGLVFPHYEGVKNQLVPSASLPRTPDGRPTNGPAWLVRGAVTYVEYRYLDMVGHEDYRSLRAAQVLHSTGIALPLADMEAYEGLSGRRAAVSFLAVEWLLERAGDTALFEYYRQLDGSETWEEAFEATFGIAVDDFYEEFEAYRARVAPPFPHFTDNSDEPVLVFLGDLPAETRVAVRVEFDAVRDYFALELRAGTADYTLYVGTDRESLVDTYVQVSGSQPPSRVCSWFPSSGAAIINPDCHAAPHRLDEVHFFAVREVLAPSLSLPPMPDGFDRRGPVWLYGAGLYINAVYHAARGYEELQTSWDRRSSRARQTARLLESMSTWEGIGTNEDFWRGTALGSLAVEWLADRAGDAAIFEYYRLLPDSETWEEAFETAFGIAVDDFSEAFEAYRARVAPPFPHVADGRVAPVLVFVGDVPADTRAAVRAEFDAVQRLFRRQLGAGTADYTLYVGANQDALVDTYVRALGSQPPERLCDRAPAQEVAIINLDCRSTAPYTLERSHLVALRRQLAPSGSLPPQPDGFAPRGPWWLRYGVDEYVGHTYRVAQGHDDLDASRNRESARARHTARLLSSTSTSAGFNVDHSQSRALGFLAVELLAELAGEAALFDYYRRLPDSESWEEAFEGAFGMAVVDFYRAFEEHRAEVAPPFAHLTDDSDGPVLMFIGDVPAGTRVAVGDEFGDLQRFYTEQLKAGTADYTMLVATDSASAKTARRLLYGGEHDRYCNDALDGVAGIVNLSCRVLVWAYALHFPHFVHVRDHLAPWSSVPLDPDGRRTRGPAWLERATAPYLEFRYVDAAGHRPYEAFRSTEVQRAKRTSRPLSSMATRDGFSGDDYWDARGVAILAIEWLTDRVGDPAIFDYYRLLPDSETWEEVFEATFGIAVDDFYEAFEAYRARVAPPDEDADAS